MAYPIRRVEPEPAHPGIDESDFRRGIEHVGLAGYPVSCPAESAWDGFAELRSQYAPLAYQLIYWTIAAPAPWTGDRAGFPETY